MALHVKEGNAVTTVQRGRHDRSRYDLPTSFDKKLEELVDQNLRAIDAWIETEDHVKEHEWDHFIDYLRKDGISESHIDYLNTKNPNYIASQELNDILVAGTYPKSSTLTYLIPADYEESRREMGYSHGLSDHQTKLMLYLHESLHNYLHDYRVKGVREYKEMEIESFLSEYFTHRALEADNEKDRDIYTRLAEVTAKRYGNLEQEIINHGGDREAAIAALAEEYGQDVSELFEYFEAYDTAAEAIAAYEKDHGEESDNQEEQDEDNNPQGQETLDEALDQEDSTEVEAGEQDD
tara:strand:- start:328 stop:1209 length:882 start_codon:yes stop_codon:yes gene_type:complete